MKPSKFSSEADLCNAFIAAVQRDAQNPWLVYPETQDWDILLVNKDDGRQIGIEAKLKLNSKVICQAIGYDRDTTPDYRAVLVPHDANTELSVIAPYCRITIIKMYRHHKDKSSYSPSLPNGETWWRDDWYEMVPTNRLLLPEYIPEVAAGVPSPLKLTPWKIGALKISVLLAETGYLTRDDFKRIGVDIRRWIGVERWLIPGDGVFVAGQNLPDFHRQHPKIWDEILADPKKWQRPAPPASPLMVFPNRG